MADRNDKSIENQKLDGNDISGEDAILVQTTHC